MPGPFRRDKSKKETAEEGLQDPVPPQGNSHIIYHDITPPISKERASSRVLGILFCILPILWALNEIEHASSGGSLDIVEVLSAFPVFITIGAILLLIRRRGSKIEGNVLIAAFSLFVFGLISQISWFALFPAMMDLYNLHLTSHEEIIIEAVLTLLMTLAPGLTYYAVSDRKRGAYAVAYILLLIFGTLFLLAEYKVYSNYHDSYLFSQLFDLLLIIITLIAVLQLLISGYPKKLFSEWLRNIPADGEVIAVRPGKKINGLLVVSAVCAILGSLLMLTAEDLEREHMIAYGIVLITSIVSFAGARKGPARHSFIGAPVMMFGLGLLTLIECSFILKQCSETVPYAIYEWSLKYFDLLNPQFYLMTKIYIFDSAFTFVHISMVIAVILMGAAIGLALSKKRSNAFRILGGFILLYGVSLSIIQTYSVNILDQILVQQSFESVSPLLSPLLMIVSLLTLGFGTLGGCDRRRVAYELGRTIPLHDDRINADQDSEEPNSPNNENASPKEVFKTDSDPVSAGDTEDDTDEDYKESSESGTYYCPYCGGRINLETQNLDCCPFCTGKIVR